MVIKAVVVAAGAVITVVGLAGLVNAASASNVDPRPGERQGREIVLSLLVLVAAVLADGLLAWVASRQGWTR